MTDWVFANWLYHAAFFFPFWIPNNFKKKKSSETSKARSYRAVSEIGSVELKRIWAYMSIGMIPNTHL